MDTVGAVVPPAGPALWSLLALQEKEDDLEVVKVIPERFVEQNAGVPVPPVVVEVEIIPKEHILERKFVEDVPRSPDSGAHLGTYCRTDCRCATPQILEEIVEAISAPHERVQQRTVEHVAGESPRSSFSGGS